MNYGDFNTSNPAFVIGTGRCGLTPLMDLIAYHKEFAWPSQYNNRFPTHYAVSSISRLVDLPIVNTKVKFLRRIPKHAEAYELWNNLFHGFARPFRDLVADDVTPYVERNFHRAVGEIMKYHHKTRFIAEYSGWSRIGFIKRIFPDARFIHVVRDGRAVAHSLINVRWWTGWEGIYKWGWGVPSQDLHRKMEKYSWSFLGLAAVHWKILINNIREMSRSLRGEEVLTIRYEEMVADPAKSAYECIRFLELDEDCEKFARHLGTVQIVDANKKQWRIPAWKANLSGEQIDMLNDLLGEELDELGYS